MKVRIGEYKGQELSVPGLGLVSSGEWTEVYLDQAKEFERVHGKAIEDVFETKEGKAKERPVTLPVVKDDELAEEVN